MSLLEALLLVAREGPIHGSAFLRGMGRRWMRYLAWSSGNGEGTKPGGLYEEMVDTGIQRLLGNLDELPDPVLGYRFLEAPEQKCHARQPRNTGSPCPLAFPNQFHHPHLWLQICMPLLPDPRIQPAAIPQQERRASPFEEMGQLYKNFGLTHFFGCDDNFFNDEQHTMGIVEKIATAEVDGIADFVRRPAGTPKSRSTTPSG